MGRKRPAAEDNRRPGLKSPFPCYGGTHPIGGFWIRNLERNTRSYLNFAASYSAKKFLEAFQEAGEHSWEELDKDDFEVRCCGAEPGDCSLIVNGDTVISWTGNGTMRDLRKYEYTAAERDWVLPDPYPNHILRALGKLQRGTLPVSKREARKEVKARMSKEGFVSIGDICAEMKIDPREARSLLRRKKVEKTELGWCWPADSIGKIKSLLKELA